MRRSLNISFKITSFLIVYLILYSVCFAQNTAPLENLKQENKKQVYIPKSLNECFSELKRLLTRKELADFKSVKEEEISVYHMGLGRWIRNNWGLWAGDSRLAKYFKDKGINNPDDMSGIILTSFYRYLNNKDIKLDEQIQYYQDYWKYATVPKGVVSPKDGAEIDFISSISEKDWHFVHYGVSKSDGSVWAYQYGKGVFEPNAEQKQKVLESK